jgi:hypothetical protein
VSSASGSRFRDGAGDGIQANRAPRAFIETRAEGVHPDAEALRAVGKVSRAERRRVAGGNDSPRAAIIHLQNECLRSAYGGLAGRGENRPESLVRRWSALERGRHQRGGESQQNENYDNFQQREATRPKSPVPFCWEKGHQGSDDWTLECIAYKAQNTKSARHKRAHRTKQRRHKTAHGTEQRRTRTAQTELSEKKPDDGVRSEAIDGDADSGLPSHGSIGQPDVGWPRHHGHQCATAIVDIGFAWLPVGNGPLHPQSPIEVKANVTDR